MLNQNSISAINKLLYKAFKISLHYTQGHPIAIKALEALRACISEHLSKRSSIVFTSLGGNLLCQGYPIEDATFATQSIALELEKRDIGSLHFNKGFSTDDLQRLFYVLHLSPQRLDGMGGPESLLPKEGNLYAIRAGGIDGVHNSAASATITPPKENTSPTIPVIPFDEIWQGIFPSESSTIIPTQTQSESNPTSPLESQLAPVFWPFGLQPSLPEVFAGLQSLFKGLVKTARNSANITFSSIWTEEQQSILNEYGFLSPDFQDVAGIGAKLGLDQMDPVLLRDTLRTSLSGLDGITQGQILLGLPIFPLEERALLKALDYLAPELLAQAVAEVYLRKSPSRSSLALLVTALLRCVKDRDIAMEAIRGRLQFEKWTTQDIDGLREAIALREGCMRETLRRMDVKRQFRIGGQRWEQPDAQAYSQKSLQEGPKGLPFQRRTIALSDNFNP